MCRSYMTLTSESRKVVHRASSGTRLILCAHSSSTLTISVAAEIPSLLAMSPYQMNDEGMAMSGTYRSADLFSVYLCFGTSAQAECLPIPCRHSDASPRVRPLLPQCIRQLQQIFW
ncbi:hypothetical protein BD311DRAFT_267385 [Dichomitus squalens]|uniref:Uncharacterized protein n=1 Tax=Dichomitus squalens TaxID=114155 RepID=A0A4Q9MPD2_9APHY|nr:hypothetical protein BD311DRAFT_267385 [Dichomitus squalens]